MAHIKTPWGRAHEPMAWALGPSAPIPTRALGPMGPESKWALGPNGLLGPDGPNGPGQMGLGQMGPGQMGPAFAAWSALPACHLKGRDGVAHFKEGRG